MPVLEKSSLHQKAVVYELSTYDTHGEVILEAGAEINSRWEFRRQEMIDPLGNVVAVDATVIVDREIAVNSLLWKGLLEDLPENPTNLYQVMAASEVPDLKSRNFLRVLGVMRYSNTLPEVEG